jgi:YVTN family beta-propeller protein
MKKLTLTISVLLSILTSTLAQSKYVYFKTIPVGDALGWDYLAVDSVNNNIYFSHGLKVLIGSLANDAIIGEIPNTLGVHGIAFDYELNKGFISNGKTNSITVFDLKTFKMIDTVALSGQNPDAILYDAFSKHVFAFNGGSHDASVIDPETLKEIKTIPLSGKPEFAVSDLKGNIYVNIEDKNEIAQIDANTLAVLKTWSTLPGEEPSGLAMDRKNNVLFSVCSNKKLVVFNINNEKVLGAIPIGGGVDAVVFDPQSSLVYSSNGEGNVTIIKQVSPMAYKIFQTLETQKGSRTMTLDTKSKKIYLPAAKYEGDTKNILPGSFEILVYKQE